MVNLEHGHRPPKENPVRVTDLLARALACLWPVGLMPVAPGTAGAALAAVLAPALFLCLPYAGRLTVLVLLFLLGAWAAGRTERLLGRTDPGCVIADELVGQWVTYLPFAALRPSELLAGFLLFRAFDIFKPWPVRSSERWFGGGLSIMLDDVLAGVYAALCLGAWMLFTD